MASNPPPDPSFHPLASYGTITSSSAPSKFNSKYIGFIQGADKQTVQEPVTHSQLTPLVLQKYP